MIKSKLTEEEIKRIEEESNDKMINDAYDWAYQSGYQKSQEDVLKIIDDFLNFDEKYINPRIILYKIEWEELKNKIKEKQKEDRK